jgi:hypothetical protein
MLSENEKQWKSVIFEIVSEAQNSPHSPNVMNSDTVATPVGTNSYTTQNLTNAKMSSSQNHQHNQEKCAATGNPMASPPISSSRTRKKLNSDSPIPSHLPLHSVHSETAATKDGNWWAKLRQYSHFQVILSTNICHFLFFFFLIVRFV